MVPTTRRCRVRTRRSWVDMLELAALWGPLLCERMAHNLREWSTGCAEPADRCRRVPSFLVLDSGSVLVLYCTRWDACLSCPPGWDQRASFPPHQDESYTRSWHTVVQCIWRFRPSLSESLGNLMNLMHGEDDDALALASDCPRRPYVPGLQGSCPVWNWRDPLGERHQRRPASSLISLTPSSPGAKQIEPTRIQALIKWPSYEFQDCTAVYLTITGRSVAHLWENNANKIVHRLLASPI
jgi:hypothetical protein